MDMDMVDMVDMVDMTDTTDAEDIVVMSTATMVPVSTTNIANLEIEIEIEMIAVIVAGEEVKDVED